jgi:hypothetical protein
MDIFTVLESIIPNEPNSNFGFIGSSLKENMGKIAESRSSSAVVITPAKKLKFLGEHFEVVVIDSDDILSLVAKDISRVIQKNRNVVCITDLSQKEVENIFEPFWFRDFNSFEVENRNIVVFKRWFGTRNLRER